MKESKPNVAIIIPGGIGTGHDNIGVPVLEQIVKLLSQDFHLTVFQLYPINPGYFSEGFELIDVYSRNPFLKVLKFFLAFLRIHRKRKFKVVHGFWAFPNGFFAVVAGILFRIKSVVSVLGGDAVSLPEINYGQLRKWVYRKSVFWTLKHAGEVNALTQYLVNNLYRFGFVRESIKIIPWGIDNKLFTYRERAFGIPVQFIHIANLHPVKDQETLLRAFKLICEKTFAHLTIIGVGISEQRVKQLILTLDLSERVTMIGLQPYHTLPYYYHSADILLHTSISEGQSEVVTEAMNCGVLVCGTQVGLMYDQPDCCVSVPIRDGQSLATEVLKLILDTERQQIIRSTAKRWADTHSIKWTVNEISSLYRP
jgi:glycosyltransferase involved in cell wall biosynthesis